MNKKTWERIWNFSFWCHTYDSSFRHRASTL